MIALLFQGSPDSSIDEDSSYEFLPTVTDIDDDETFMFYINAVPTWAIFDSSTGELTGTPNNDDVGFYDNIIIGVSDGDSRVSLNAFSITVNNTNDAPIISTINTQIVSEDIVSPLPFYIRY